MAADSQSQPLQGDYTVPDFEKAANAYRIKAQTLSTYTEIENCKDWLYDNEPCLINILLPKMDWNQKDMLPALDDEVMKEVQTALL